MACVASLAGSLIFIPVYQDHLMESAGNGTLLTTGSFWLAGLLFGGPEVIEGPIRGKQICFALTLNLTHRSSKSLPKIG